MGNCLPLCGNTTLLWKMRRITIFAGGMNVPAQRRLSSLENAQDLKTGKTPKRQSIGSGGIHQYAQVNRG